MLLYQILLLTGNAATALASASADNIIRVEVALDSKIVAIETSLARASEAAAGFCRRYAITPAHSCRAQIVNLVSAHATSKTRTLVLAMSEPTAQEDVRSFCAQHALSSSVCEDLIGLLPRFFAQREQQCSDFDRGGEQILLTTVPKSGTTIALLLLR